MKTPVRPRSKYDELAWMNEWADGSEDARHQLRRIAAALEALVRGKLKYDECPCEECGCTNTEERTESDTDQRRYLFCPACDRREYFCGYCNSFLEPTELNTHSGLCQQCESGNGPVL